MGGTSAGGFRAPPAIERRPRPTRIVLVTYGSSGDLFPFLAIGTELRSRGHEVVVATSAFYRDAVRGAGLGFAAVRPDRRAGQHEPDFLDRVRQERQSPERVFRAMFLPGLRDSLEDLGAVVDGAGLVVSHTLTPAAPLAAEVAGVPWVSTVMQPMGYLSAHEPPVVALPWVAAVQRATGHRCTALAHALARRLTAPWMREWHQLRAEAGLSPTSMHPLWEGRHSPLRSLGLFPRILGEPQPDWPPQARVTGFPFHRSPEAVLEPLVADFLASGKPPLIFTLGTTAVNAPGAFYDESAAAAQRLGKRALLLGGGHRVESIGDTVLVVPYAPHDLVFPRAVAIVHQGGIGTLSEALLAGKPMLIAPFAHDQFDNAWRAERLGVARRIARRRYGGDVVVRALSALLDDPTTALAAQKARQHVVRDLGTASAADAIERALLR